MNLLSDRANPQMCIWVNLLICRVTVRLETLAVKSGMLRKVQGQVEGTWRVSWDHHHEQLYLVLLSKHCWRNYYTTIWQRGTTDTMDNKQHTLILKMHQRNMTGKNYIQKMTEGDSLMTNNVLWLQKHLFAMFSSGETLPDINGVSFIGNTPSFSQAFVGMLSSN